MKTISFIQGLMRFNQRVLSMGEIEEDVVYSMEELKEKLFFNKIFMSNTQEMFQKYACDEVLPDYIESLDEYVGNIDSIINKMEELDLTIRVTRAYSFEQALFNEINIGDDCIINQAYPLKDKIQYPFLNNVIYYLTLLNEYSVMLSYVDPRRSIYGKAPSYSYNNEYIIYCKSDDCVRNKIYYQFHQRPTVAMKVTSIRDAKIGSDLNSMISKVEYSGEIGAIRDMMKIFPDDVPVIRNPYIYLDDIGSIIDDHIKEIPTEVVQVTTYLDPNLVFNMDVLLEHPYTSFDVYLEFLKDCIYNGADSIRISLYRIGENPALYNVLKLAIHEGVHVHVNIELDASGEKINKFWANEMRNLGIEVSHYGYGSNIKVHSKMTLIYFKNGKRIVQIGTGNFHTETTSQYTDLSLLTSNEDICMQCLSLFEILEGKGARDIFNSNFLVTKYNAKSEIVKLISEQAVMGKHGYIAIKCNTLDDITINAALTKAANRGCKIDLIVRGTCTWIPQELGNNVKIKSIIWDKLEHSRIFCFGKKDPIVYIGSLDLVWNKINKRIETMVKIKDPDVLHDICEYLNAQIVNTKDSWIMVKSGEYFKEG